MSIAFIARLGWQYGGASVTDRSVRAQTPAQADRREPELVNGLRGRWTHRRCRLRSLTIVNDCTRECLAIEVDTSITGVRVQAVLDRLDDTRDLPKSITVDNGPEFDGQGLDKWAYRSGVQLSFIRSGEVAGFFGTRNRAAISG